jgi:hypothetical protein
MSGSMPVMFVGVEPAGAGNAALHLVQHQHQIMLVGEIAQAAHEGLGWPGGCRPRPGSARPESLRYARRPRAGRLEIVERTTVKAGSSGAKPSRSLAWSVALIVPSVRP